MCCKAEKSKDRCEVDRFLIDVYNKMSAVISVGLGFCTQNAVYARAISISVNAELICMALPIGYFLA